MWAAGDFRMDKLRMTAVARVSLLIPALLLQILTQPLDAHGWHYSYSKIAGKQPPADKLPVAALARLGSLEFCQPYGSYGLAWSADGKTILAGDDGTKQTHLWDVASGRKSGPILSGFQTGLATFSPNGKKLALMREGRICILEGDKLATELERPVDVVVGYHLSWSQDGKTLASGAKGMALLYDLETGKIKYGFKLPPNHVLGTTVALSPDGKLLAAAGSFYSDTKNGIFLWSAITGEQRGFLKGHRQGPTCLAFSPDGALLISISSDDQTMRFWDVAKEMELDRFEVRASKVAFSPNGQTVAAWGAFDSSTVYFWDAKTRKKIGQLDDCGGRVAGLAFSPDSKRVITGGYSAAMRIWDVATGKEITLQRGHLAAVTDLVFSPDGKWLASRGGDRTVRLWDWKAGKELHRLDLAGPEGFFGHSPGPRPRHVLAFSSDGKYLVAGGRPDDKSGMIGEHVVHLFDTANLKEKKRWEEPGFSPLALQFSPDNQLLAVASWGGLRLRAVPSGDERGLLAVPGKGEGAYSFDWSAAFALDGSFVASGATNAIRFWDPGSKTLLGTLQTEGWAANQISICPNGLLVTLEHRAVRTEHSNDLSARVNLYEHGTRSRAATAFQNGPVNWNKAWTNGCMAVSSDCRLIAVSGIDDPLVRVWDTLTLKEVAKFEGHLGPVLCLAFSPDGKVLASGSMDSTILLWDTSGLAKLPPAAALAAKDLDRLWADLRARDAAAAYPALARLAAGRNQALPFLAKHLSPVPEPDAKRVGQLLVDLNDDKPAVREQASKELAQLGGLVEPALRQRLAAKPPVEVQQRLEALLQKLKDAPVPDDELRRLRAVWLLEYLGTPEARDLLTALARGAGAARSTRAARDSLKRLAAPGK
jgi:WD40 repeat protein